MPDAWASIPRLWSGETAVLIASGSSLTQEDVDWCQGKARVLAVNDSYRKAPWADLLYASDPRWWDSARGADEFAGMRVTQCGSTAARWGLTRVAGRVGAGLSCDPALIHFGGNSGFAAANLAALLGAARLLLLGYDMKGAHWFGWHPPPLTNPREHTFRKWREAFRIAAPDFERLGVEVLNCSPGSALDCFPRSTIREALPA